VRVRVRVRVAGKAATIPSTDKNSCICAGQLRADGQALGTACHFFWLFCAAQPPVVSACPVPTPLLPTPLSNSPSHTLQDAREDLAATEAAVVQLQAQVDALMAAGEMAAEVAAQLDEASQSLEVGGRGGEW